MSSRLDSLTDALRNANGQNLIKPLSIVAERHKPSSDVFPTGYIDFDNAMDGGWRGGELIVVSGRTGEGKTTWCQNVSMMYASRDIPSLWFSFEMSPWYLKQKFELISDVDGKELYAPEELMAHNLEDIEKKILSGIQQYACKVVFIDHLHYLTPLKTFGENVSFAVGNIVRELKLMAVKHDVIIVLIAHTKKIDGEEELSLSSIRDSSLISQEADYVFLIERLKLEKKLKLMASQGTDWTNEAKIQLAKNRRKGELFYKKFRMQEGVFTNTEEEEYGEYITQAK